MHRDHLQSIRLETAQNTAAAGAVKRQDYSAYGEARVTDNGQCSGGSRGYIGERAEPELGLSYLNARWYDPVIGRFLQPDWWDPIDVSVAAAGGPAGMLSSPVGTNRYAYAANDPINKMIRMGMPHER